METLQYNVWTERISQVELCLFHQLEAWEGLLQRHTTRINSIASSCPNHTIAGTPFFRTIKQVTSPNVLERSIVGSMVECSPPTRTTRVRFPDDAASLSTWLFFFSFRPALWVTRRGFESGGGPVSCSVGETSSKERTVFKEFASISSPFFVPRGR